MRQVYLWLMFRVDKVIEDSDIEGSILRVCLLLDFEV